MSLSASLLNVGRPVAYYPRLAQFFGSVNVAILFAQLHYWHQRSENDLGIYKTSGELEQETGLSYREQVTARKHLRNSGLMTETHRRLEHRVYYRLDLDAVDAAFEVWTKAQLPNDKSAIGEQPKAQSGGDAPRNPGAAESSLDELRKAQSVISTEITKETTTETTAVITAKAKAKAEPLLVTAPNGTVYEIPAELKYPGQDAKSHKAWIAYAIAYEHRYHSWPLWNATVGGQICKFIERVGADLAPRIAVHYVRRVNEEFIVKQMHPVKLLLSDAEKWATQQQTGASMTSTRAKQADQLDANASVGADAMAIIRAQRAAAQGGPDA